MSKQCALAFLTTYNKLMTPERQPSSTESWRGSTMTILPYRSPDYHQTAAPQVEQIHILLAREGARRAMKKLYINISGTTVQRNCPNPVPLSLNFFWPSEHPEYMCPHTRLCSWDQDEFKILCGARDYYPTDRVNGWFQRPNWSWPRILAPHHWPLWCK